MKLRMFLLCVMAYNMNGAQGAPFGDNTYFVRTDGGVDQIDDLGRKIYRLPGKLSSFKEIRIHGYFFWSTERLTVNLVTANDKGQPDFNNIACQVKAYFGNPEVSQLNKTITINTIVDGVLMPPKDEQEDPDEWLSTLDFAVAFKINPRNDKKIGLEIQRLPTMHSCDLKHRMDDIEFLTIGGDFDRVESLHFVVAP